MTTLIASAAYVSDEISAEYGRLPPAFLPVGHHRLYELQLAELSKVPDRVYLSVPESYKIESSDSAALARSGVTIIEVPDNLTLDESLLYSILMMDETEEPLRIMFGDTLIYNAPDSNDLVSVSSVADSYKWGVIDKKYFKEKSQQEPVAFAKDAVVSGYFKFSDVTNIKRCLVRCDGNFLDAIADYNESIKLEYWQTDNWLDFGHLQTFYRSRCAVRTQRSFNELDINFHMIEKHSLNAEKIVCESQWFENLPYPLRAYTPSYLGKGLREPSYRLEYLPLPTLHELFVFGRLNKKVWRLMLDACFEFMNECIGYKINENGIQNSSSIIERLTIEKSISRIQRFEQEFGLSDSVEWVYNGKKVPTLQRIAEISMQMIDSKDSRFLGVMHGDLCFTNIFFDFRTQKIRVIDPRGGVELNTPSVFGDVRYDMAKFAHSIIGGYDLILANKARCSGFDSREICIDFPDEIPANNLVDVINEFDVHGLRITDHQIRGIMIHLFLSMLPLHSDRPDRQKSFIANAIRLFSMGDA